MRSFVAGATGHTGREVVRLLRERGEPTIAHVRPDSSRLSEWVSRFESSGASVDTTPWTREAMGATLLGLQPTAVYALLGTTRKRGQAAKRHGATESYETVDFGLSQLLLEAAVGCGSKPSFVYLSSVGVSPSTTNAYLSVRYRLESNLRASGLPWAIARPSFIGGERDERRPGETLGIAVGDGALALVGVLGGRKLRERYRSQTNAELARALVEIGLRGDTLGKVHESDALRRLGAGGPA